MARSWIGFVVLGLWLVQNFADVESSDDLQCMDEENRPVDWFIMYKIPKIGTSSNRMIRDGAAYQYMTSDSVSSGWTLSTKSVTMENSMVGNTLSPLYKTKVAAESIWVLYNDRPAVGETTHSTKGHAKGVLMANKKKGFWLVHSVPAFPSVPKTGENKRGPRTVGGGYAYPPSGLQYGQMLLCISIDRKQVDIVARQLKYDQIMTYRTNLPPDLAMKYPQLVEVANEVRIKDPPYENILKLRSIGGVDFTAFAKTDKYQKDLYGDLIGPHIGSSLLSQTWQNGPEKLPPKCNGNFRVEDVQYIELWEANVKFDSSNDHSKWAISNGVGAHGNWVCVGDINRARTQFNRGGGAVCLQSLPLWLRFESVIKQIKRCP